MCTAAGVSFSGWGKSVSAYCHAISMSKVGTKNEAGAEAMRSRNLIGSVCVSDAGIISSFIHTHDILPHSGATQLHLCCRKIPVRSNRAGASSL